MSLLPTAHNNYNIGSTAIDKTTREVVYIVYGYARSEVVIGNGIKTYASKQMP